MPDLIAELMELPDFTQDAIDNSVDVAAFKGIKIDSFTKLPLKVRVSHYNDWLNELFKSKGGFVNGYQSEGTVKKELGISFDVGKDKEIGFMLNPEEKKAELGFKMKFAEAGAVGTGGELTFQQAFKDRIAEMQRKLDAGGRMSQGEIDKANRTYARLFGGTHSKRTYKSVLQDVFPDKKVSEILFSEVNTSEIQKQIYTKAQNQVWYKGKYGAAMDFQKQISGAIGNVVGVGKTASAFNAAAPYKNSELVLQGGKPGRGPVLDEDIYRNTVKQINKIKDASAKRLAKIMLLQGIRETDLVKIKVSDIDWNKNTITTISKKGAGARVIPISDSVKILLQQQANANPKGATIFSKPNVKPGVDFKGLADHYGDKINPKLNNISVFDTIKDADRAMTLEDLRRAFSLRADALGISSDIQDKLMGHTIKGTKATYQKGITTTALKAINVEDAIKLTGEDLYKQLGFTSADDVTSFLGGKYRVRGAASTLGQQVEEITQPKVTQPIVEQKLIGEPKPVIKSGVEDVEIEKKAKTSVSGKNYTELPSANNKKISLALEKAGKTGKLATILKLGLKAGVLLAPLEPIQFVNEALGGKEGAYQDKLFGVFEPTISKEVEAWKELGTQVKGLFGQDQQDVI